MIQDEIKLQPTPKCLNSKFVKHTSSSTSFLLLPSTFLTFY